MTVEDVEILDGKEVKIYLKEPTNFGEKDCYREEIIDLEDPSRLPTITQEEIDALPRHEEQYEEAEIVEVFDLRLVFINSFDTEHDSVNHRSQAHEIKGGPYLLV